MKKEVKNIPDLRFPMFDVEWSPKNISDLFDIKHGFAFKGEYFSSNGKYIVLTPGNFNHSGGFRYQGEKEKYYSTLDFPIDYILQKGDLLTAMTEQAIGLIGSPILVPESNKFLHNQRLGLFKSKSDINNGFMFHYMQTEQLRTKMSKSASGMKVRHTSPKLIGGIGLSIPILPEQQKIASFLTAIDKKIEQLTRKRELLEQYKKGVMQNIFSQKIRFKDDNGEDYPDWEEKKLREVGKTFNGLSGKSAADFGKGFPFITYKQVFDDSRIDITKFQKVSIGNNENQTLVLYGDVLFTTSSETRLEVGMSSVLLDKIDSLYLNSFCFGYRITSQPDFSPKFARYIFRSEELRRDISRLGQGSTRYNLSKKEMMKLPMLLPIYEEQRKIANFISSIDDKINKVKIQLTQTQNFKKGLLQKMFV